MSGHQRRGAEFSSVFHKQRRAAQVEELHATATVRRLPKALGTWLRDSPVTQDALISNIEYVLALANPSPAAQ